jgi:hypothetical protein
VGARLLLVLPVAVTVADSERVSRVGGLEVWLGGAWSACLSMATGGME